MDPPFTRKFDEDLAYGLANYIGLKKNWNLPMNSSNHVERIIGIDHIAHSLHQESHLFKKCTGYALYPILDELAGISKELGEENRDDRLLILNDISPAKELNQIQIFNKSLDSSKSMWKLMETAIKNGVESLNDEDIILLREWMYSKI